MLNAFKAIITSITPTIQTPTIKPLLGIMRSMREKVGAKHKEYYQKNKERICEYQRQYRAEKKEKS